MDLMGSANLQQAIRDIQTYPEYQNVLRVLLKHEISTLVQRLSEAGEESVVMIASVSDGAMSVLGSNFGERFVLEPGNDTNIVRGFKEKFAEFCYTRAPKKRKRYDHGHRLKPRSPPSYKMENVTKEASYRKEGVTKELKESGIKWQQEPASKYQQAAATKCQKDVMNDGNVLMNGNRLPHSDKAIDETVSQLVKNIFKESEERERELGEGDCGTRRRRRRRRTLNDHTKRDNRYDPCYRRKETKIAQFFPTISEKCIEYRSSQDEGSTKQQDMYLTDIKIKIEPDTDDTVSDTGNRPVSEGQEIHNVPEEPSNDDCEIVINSVDKSIQKIIEMETRNPSANDSYETEHMSDGLNTDGDVANVRIKQEPVTVSDAENEDRMIYETINTEFSESSEIVNDVNTFNMSLDSQSSEYEGYIPIDGTKIKEEQLDQLNRSFEESSAEDCPDDLSSLRKKQKRNFVHNGFSYIRDKAGKGDTVYWKCGKIGCKGRVIQRGGEKIRTQDHNHNPFMDNESEKSDSSSTLYQ